MIEAVHGEGDVLGCDGIEAHFLWKELTDKSVHVLVGVLSHWRASWAYDYAERFD